MQQNKELQIVQLFLAKVYQKKPNIIQANRKHHGAVGHWLETAMGITHNRNNIPDLLGYEMKTDTTSGKTTFGDWSADFYLFKSSQNPSSTLLRDQFIEIFGKPNPLKNNRYSWSGSPIPTIHHPSSWNGSRMVVDKNDMIKIIYDYSKDPRKNKSKIIPSEFKKNSLILASWSRAHLEQKVNSKFSQNGWFKCYRNSGGVYDRIGFGEPMNFDSWIYLVRQGIVYFDSGMYVGNSRNYSQWRANNNYWDSLVIRSYP